MDTLYDMIGCGYAGIRKPDPRIAKAILRALENNGSVVNVGAGAGSYEPLDRYVVAVEPSLTMIAQRPAGSAPVVQASAVSLPFINDSFDAAGRDLLIGGYRTYRVGTVATCDKAPALESVGLVFHDASDVC